MTKEEVKEIGYKIVERYDYETKQYAKFALTGQWCNGAYAYSKLEKDGSIKEENEGVYVQKRCNGLIMFHI